MVKYQVVIEKGNDGIYVGYVPALPGCHSDGETIDELLKNLKEAIELYREVNELDETESVDFIGIQTLEV